VEIAAALRAATASAVIASTTAWLAMTVSTGIAIRLRRSQSILLGHHSAVKLVSGGRKLVRPFKLL
jgi:hypothetical protein